VKRERKTTNEFEIFYRLHWGEVFTSPLGRRQRTKRVPKAQLATAQRWVSLWARNQICLRLAERYRAMLMKLI